MKATPFLLAALTAVVHVAAAQEVQLKPVAPAVESPVAYNQGEITPIHVTDRLTASPEGQAGLRAFYEARAAGTLEPAGKSAAACVVGSTKDFNVLTAVSSDNPTWKKVGFTCRASSDIANVWVDTSLNGSVNQDQLDEVERVLLQSTPTGSFRPDAGIIENDNYLFGNPPNIDGDGKVDVLLFDIFEGIDDCCVLGFVTSSDLNLNAPSTQGNKADILYVDVKDGLAQGVSTMGWVMSHEYQHLIHYNYDRDELTFVNEGLSEWASVANGYANRSIRYLSNVSEHATKLLDWRENQGILVVENDYQRAGLFTTYLAERLGVEGAGSITRAKNEFDQPAFGKAGYEVVLAEHSLSLNDVVADFHVANFLNNKNVAAQYGYTPAGRRSFAVVPSVSVDGKARSSWEQLDMNIAGGAVRYITFSDVADIAFFVDIYSQIAAGDKDGDRARTELRAIAEHQSGDIEVLELPAGPETSTIHGDFRRVTLVVTSTSLVEGRQLRLDVEANWSPGGSSGISRQTVAYDDGKAATTKLENARYLTVGEDARQASRFDVPDGSRLSKIYLAPIYDNQFVDSDVPDGAPRDFRLHLWTDDGTGDPGAELYHVDVTDNPDGTHLNFSNQQYLFLEHTLPSDDPLFSELPTPIYIGVSNIGTDQNYLVMTVSAHAGSGESFLNLPNFGPNNSGGWAALGDIFFRETNGDSTFIFEDRVVPIRAEFVISTATEDAPGEMPSTVTLDQNYPNPFNPTTAITYDLPRSMNVRLSVYDALGRRVATFVDGLEGAGAHQVSVDATGWSSGVYLYTLETEAATLTRKMLVLK